MQRGSVRLVVDETLHALRHPKGSMMIRAFLIVALAAGSVDAVQQPARVDTSRIGPQAGAIVPSFQGIDQFGNSQSLSSVYGPKGAMLVFFRSADW